MYAYHRQVGNHLSAAARFLSNVYSFSQSLWEAGRVGEVTNVLLLCHQSDEFTPRKSWISLNNNSLCGFLTRV